jgi:muramoyltetrapeptide carboxypeptidase LdcA involved in peptidoglycan recycling
MKPPPLQHGDTIGVVSPSWGAAGAFPHRVEQAISFIQSLGFRVKLAPHALNQRRHVSDTPECRASDIHEMFADPEVKAIVAAVGGAHSCHLLPLMNFDLISRNPKIFMGFSDITVLNIAIWHKTGLVTFNGPALLTDFGEYPRMFPYTEKHFLKCVASTHPIGEVDASTEWTEEFLDWTEKKDRERPRRLESSGGWTWLKEGRTEGRLIGGCLESLQHLRGTEYWPDWNDAIFFFETSEAKPSPERVDAILMDYENMGVLERLQGLLVGRPMYYSPAEKERLRQVILGRTAKYPFPVVTDMDFGHTAPQFTLPIGCRACIDAAEQTFRILEPAVTL